MVNKVNVCFQENKKMVYKCINGVEHTSLLNIYQNSQIQMVLMQVMNNK